VSGTENGFCSTLLQAGCIGGGYIAERHLDVLARFPDVKIVAVADAMRERAQAAAARYGARAYTDGLALLQSENLDAVWLCVPPFAHGPLELAAAERGVPFFVEKPLAADVDTALAVAQQVRQTGLTTAVGYHWRYLEVVDRAAAMLRGNPVRLVLGYWLDSTPPVPWWTRRGQSGGQVIEQTTHIFDLARYLAGPVESVQALEAITARDRFPGADVPTAATAMLRFSSGAIGTVSSTCLLGWRHQVALSVVTDDVVVEVREQALADHELRIVSADGEQIVRSAEDPTAREDRAFLDAVQGRQGRIRVPYEEALQTHVLAAAADRAAREGVPVSLAQGGHDE
jgi:myo-inositol 2-dehydrogenase / D-chiro-inositol 1-dehydrogenase